MTKLTKIYILCSKYDKKSCKKENKENEAMEKTIKTAKKGNKRGIKWCKRL